VVSISATDSIADVVELLRRYGISQTPVMEGGRMVGSLTEDLLLRHLASGEPLDSSTVAQLQGPPFPTLEADTSAREAYTLFNAGQSQKADQSRPRHPEEDHTTLATAWRVSRAQAATPPSSEGERVCRFPSATLE